MEKISNTGMASKCSESRLSEIIDAYEKLVFSICYKLTGDYFAAEDLSQETFLAVYQRFETFDGNNEKAWICRIATNKSIDYLRSQKHGAVPAQEELFETVMEKRGSPEEQCMEAEIKEQLEKNCESLRPPYDEIARDYYLGEMSAAEIAEKRNAKVKTIQTQIYRARDMLRKLYRKEETE